MVWRGNILFSLGAWQFKGSQVLAIVSILVLSGINLRGINLGKLVQTTFTIAKLASIFGLIILGLTLGYNADVVAQNLTDIWHAQRWTGNGFEAISGQALVIALGGAMVGTLFSSDAWNNVTFIAGEIKNPASIFPKACFWDVDCYCIVSIDQFNLSFVTTIAWSSRCNRCIVGRNRICYQ
jgi:APA family basic amino acid/polyamine antiporter